MTLILTCYCGTSSNSFWFSLVSVQNENCLFDRQLTFSVTELTLASMTLLSIGAAAQETLKDNAMMNLHGSWSCLTFCVVQAREWSKQLSKNHDAKSGLKRWWLWRKFWFKTNSLCSTMDCPLAVSHLLALDIVCVKKCAQKSCCHATKLQTINK